MLVQCGTNNALFAKLCRAAPLSRDPTPWVWLGRGRGPGAVQGGPPHILLRIITAVATPLGFGDGQARMPVLLQ